MRALIEPPMYDYIEKKDCCGCESCLVSCPVGAISFIEDREGFFYPYVDEDKCVKCLKCVAKCPIVNEKSMKRNSVPPTCYIGSLKDKDEVLLSSSGGAFYALGLHFVNSGQWVYGVRWADDFKSVYHFGANNSLDLQFLRESKYIQSRKIDIFRDVKQKLDMKFNVFFTGCSCEIAGLLTYLGREYPELYTAEVICHGPTSPRISREWVENLEKRYNSKIVKLSLRKKINEETFPFMIEAKFSNGKVYRKPFFDSEFGAVFSILQRPSCYNCKFKKVNRIADFTLGDIYGELKNDTLYKSCGTSCIMVNSEKGYQLWKQIENFEYKEVSFSEIKRDIPIILKSWSENSKRNIYVSLMNKVGVIKAARKVVDPKRRIKMIISDAMIQRIKRVKKIIISGS